MAKKAVGMTVGIGADTQKFEKGIRAMNRQIKNTMKEVNALNDSLKIDFDISRFETAQAKAQEALTKTEDKIELLRKQMKLLEEAGKIDTNHYANVSSELIRAEANAVLLKQKLEDIKNLKFTLLVKDIENVGKNFEEAGQRLKTFSVAATAILGSFAAIGLTSISAGKELKQSADQLNLSAESLQKWTYIGQQLNVEQSTLKIGLARTQKALAQMSVGEASRATDVLRQLGFTQAEAALGMEANFEKVIVAVSNVKDETMRAYFANELFETRMAARMIPLLREGGEGLQKLADEFHDFGYISNNNVDRLNELNKTLNKIKYQFGLIKNELAIAFIPLMEKLGDILQDYVIPFVNRLEKSLAKLSDKQIETAAKVLVFIAALSPLLLIIGKTIGGVGSLVKAFGTLNSSLLTLAANPVMATLIIIVALFTAMYAKNEQFRESVNQLVSVLSKGLAPIFKMLGNSLSMLIKMLSFWIDLLAVVLTPILKKIGKLWDVIFSKIGEGFDWLTEKTQAFFNFFIDGVNKAIEWVNKLARVFGAEISQIERFDWTTKVEDGDVDIDTTLGDEVSRTTYATTPTTIINNDYSDKDIKVEVIVQNYAEHVDVDQLVREINMKLAGEM